MKVLIVIDMQKDFVTGALANPAAAAIAGGIANRIEQAESEGWLVLFTRDTHSENYMETQEGRMLPVPHCIKGTDGWQIIGELAKYQTTDNTLDKPSFGSAELPEFVRSRAGNPEAIVLVGTCTDICVISNAMILKAAFPETEISVEGGLCAGVTAESHDTALKAMTACQIRVC